jgi:DNA-directed RNA polymerase specialized sigma24 family protein
MTRYSNNPTLLDDLRYAREVVLSQNEDDEPELGRQRRASGRRWAMAHRLTAEDVRAVVSGYRAGRTARELAERFSVSESSVKRLVRRAGCRKRGVPPNSRSAGQ